MPGHYARGVLAGESAVTKYHGAAGFYAEVAVEVEPAPDDPIARFGIAEGRSVIRWWYAPDPVCWRWEIETVGTIIDDSVALTVVNGDRGRVKSLEVISSGSDTGKATTSGGADRRR